jgi:hypothetical protein
MNVDRDANLDRLSDLLADRATQRLSAAEAAELIALLASCPDVDEHAFDRAAAAVDLSSIAGEYEPLPPSVRARVDRSAVAWLAQRKGLRLADVSPAGPDVESSGPMTAPRKPGYRGWPPRRALRSPSSPGGRRGARRRWRRSARPCCPARGPRPSPGPGTRQA